jgi:hypothetical protein
MLWKVLSNKYSKLKFGTHRDAKGTTAAKLGLDGGDTSSKVLIYPVGSKSHARYEGRNSFIITSRRVLNVLYSRFS